MVPTKERNMRNQDSNFLKAVQAMSILKGRESFQFLIKLEHFVLVQNI